MSKLILLAFCTFCLGLSAQQQERNLTPYSDGKLWGYMDLDKWNNFEDRDIVIPAKYEEANEFSDGLAMVKENGKFGYIDRSGKYIVLPYLNDATDFENGVAFVKLGTKCICINKKGEEVEFPHQPTLDFPVTSDKYTVNMDNRYNNPLILPEGLSILRLKLNWKN